MIQKYQKNKTIYIHIALLLLIIANHGCAPSLDSSNWRQRVKAVNNLTDPLMLAKIALESEHASMRTAAIKHEKLTDQKVFAQIALYDDSIYFRKEALKRIIDQSVLAKIALEDQKSYIREEATRKLTDQQALERIALEDQKPSIRKEATQKIINQEVLRKIALEDKNEDVRYAAFTKLINPDYDTEKKYYSQQPCIKVKVQNQSYIDAWFVNWVACNGINQTEILSSRKQITMDAILYTTVKCSLGDSSEPKTKIIYKSDSNEVILVLN